MRKGFAAFVLAIPGLISSLTAGPIVYIAANTPAGQFGTLDLGTGAVTVLGPLPGGSVGMAYGPGGQLYNLTWTLTPTNQLETVNPANTSVTAIGSVNSQTIAFGGNGSSLFGFQRTGGNGNYGLDLYSFSSTTGAGSRVGTSLGLVPNLVQWATSSGSSTIYLVVNHTLYTVDPTTGTSTVVGDTGTDLAHSLVDIVLASGVLYGISQDLSGGKARPGIYTIDQKTGAATFVTNVLGNVDAIYGAAPVPEPATLATTALGGMVLLGVAAWRRRGNPGRTLR